MAKKTGIALETISATIESNVQDTYELKEQKSFLQVKGPNGHRMYVAIQKMCRRVDLAFEPEGLELASLVPARGENGSVKHELDTDHPDFLADLALLLVWMASAPPVPKAKKTAFVPKLPVMAQRQAGREERKELIERVAREKGVEISQGADL